MIQKSYKTGYVFCYFYSFKTPTITKIVTISSARLNTQQYPKVRLLLEATLIFMTECLSSRNNNNNKGDKTGNKYEEQVLEIFFLYFRNV